MDAQQTEGFAKGWIQAWNQRDLEAVLSHYTEDIEFQSPLVVQAPRRDFRDRLGKTESAGVFPKGVGGLSRDIELELLGAYQGVNSLLIHFQAKGRKAVEVMELNQEGKVCPVP